MFAYALALVLCVVGTTGQFTNWCPRTTDYAFCPAFDYEDYTVGDCPDGWTCEGEAKVSTYYSLYSGNPFFRIGDDNEIGSATSDYFPVPDGTYDLRWERCGGADDGGVIIQDSQGNTICDVRDGTDTDTFFEQNCVLDGYAGQCIRIYTWDSVSGGWGKTFLRDFQFRDASGGDLESCSTEQRFVAVNTEMTWSDANDYCASEYGTSLATITSDDEATALTAFLTSDKAWIGLNDIDNEGTWVWASGYECEGDCVNPDWWSRNEPNGGNGESCVERYSSSSWPFLNDAGCDNTRYFICDAYTHDISNGRFVAVNTEMTWSNANDYCYSQYGTSLATITSEEEATAITAFLTSDRLWIGLNDIENEGTWVWESGYQCEGDCADLDWWRGGQPSDSIQNENCGERYPATLWSDGKTCAFNDAGCSNSHYFICDGYYPDNFVRFVAVDTKMSWNNANAYCASEYGTSLATITSDDEATALLDLITSDSAWIGLNDIDNEGTWVWASGYECEGDCADLDWWDGGEPNDFGSNGEDCAYRHDRTAWPYLNDVTCTDLHYFICDGYYINDALTPAPPTPAPTTTTTPAPTTTTTTTRAPEPTEAPSNSPTQAPSNSPTPAPTTPSAHYVAIGSTHQIGKMDGRVESYCQKDDNNQAAYFSTKHDYDIGVGCCSEDGSTGYRPDCNAHPATYQEAVDLCTANGHRLCTLQEMLSGTTRGKGCWYDAAYNWVSDECQYEVFTDAAAAVSGGAAISEEADEANSTGNGSLDWMTTVIGAMIGVVAIGAVVVFLMLMTKKKKRAAEEEKTEMSNAVPQHVVPEMSISSVAVPATTSGATVEV